MPNEMFEGKLEMVRKGKIEELPSGSESEGEEEEAVILLRYSRGCSLYTSCRVSLSLIFTLCW